MSDNEGNDSPLNDDINFSDDDEVKETKTIQRSETEDDVASKVSEVVERSDSPVDGSDQGEDEDFDEGRYLRDDDDGSAADSDAKGDDEDDGLQDSEEEEDLVKKTKKSTKKRLREDKKEPSKSKKR